MCVTLFPIFGDREMPRRKIKQTDKQRKIRQEHRNSHSSLYSCLGVIRDTARFTHAKLGSLMEQTQGSSVGHSEFKHTLPAGYGGIHLKYKHLETEAGGSKIQGQLGLQSETLSHNNSNSICAIQLNLNFV